MISCKGTAGVARNYASPHSISLVSYEFLLDIPNKVIIIIIIIIIKFSPGNPNPSYDSLTCRTNKE